MNMIVFLVIHKHTFEGKDENNRILLKINPNLTATKNYCTLLQINTNF